MGFNLVLLGFLLLLDVPVVQPGHGHLGYGHLIPEVMVGFYKVVKLVKTFKEKFLGEFGNFQIPNANIRRML